MMAAKQYNTTASSLHSSTNPYVIYSGTAHEKKADKIKGLARIRKRVYFQCHTCPQSVPSTAALTVAYIEESKTHNGIKRGSPFFCLERKVMFFFPPLCLFHDPLTNFPSSCLLTIQFLWRWSSTQVIAIQNQIRLDLPGQGHLWDASMVCIPWHSPCTGVALILGKSRHFLPFPNPANAYKLYDKLELDFPWHNGTIAV